MSAASNGSTPPEIDNSTPILIFGLSRGALHHGALGIARSGGRLGIPVYRVGRERWGPAALSRYSRGWLAVSDRFSDEAILDALLKLGERIGRAMLVPIDDVGSVFVDTHTEALKGAFLFPDQPPGLARELSSKRGMYELCQKHGIPTPVSLFPGSEADVIEQAEQMSYPTVVKCINVGDTAPSAPRVAIARDREHLLRAYRLMESPRGHNVMLQEYIPGTPESVWMFNGYFDRNSDCRIGFTGRKIRQSPPYTGVTTLGVCEVNDTVKESTTRLMKTVGYRGIIDIGYRYDARDDSYNLLDVNPRIGGTFRLFVGPDGIDVLRAMYLDLTDQEIPASIEPNGRRWLVEPQDLISSVVYRRRGDITVPGWARSLRGVSETAWFARDDPLPFLALWLGALVYWAPRRLLGR